MKQLSVPMQSLCLVIIVLGVYFSAIYAPLNPVDDRALIDWLYSMEGKSFTEFFTWTTGNYYRPVLQTTYLLDMRLWGAEQSFMHLENVLLHLLNVLLVFACARIAFDRYVSKSQWPPFLAALLFAIHPINTEAVNWVAGRSDLLASFFVLLATWLLLKGLVKNSPLFCWLSLLPLIPGFLSKETAVFFIPAGIVLILCDNSTFGGNRPGLWQRVKVKLPFLFPYLILPFLYLLIRVCFLFSRDAGLGLIGKFFSAGGDPPLVVVQKVLTGIGFYFKKLVFPWPLNFTIFQIPDYYFWLGLLLLPLLFYSLWRFNVIGGFFIASFFITTSALLVLLLRPAWTPFAERYLYLPSAFFSIAIVFLFAHLYRGSPPRTAFSLVLVVLFCGTTYATIDRNLLWQDNVLLFEDAVEKSPNFPFARSVLADLLIEAGRVEEGKALIRSNTAPEGLRNADFLDLKRAQLLFIDGDYEQAKSFILTKRRKGKPLYYSFQSLLANVDIRLLRDLKGDEKRQLLDETINLLLELRQVYQDPLYYYRIGKLYLQCDDKKYAGKYFRLASEQAPEGAYYKTAAATLAEKLVKP
ncbi:MAG: glycosyltransferase family 39 protein [Desulfobulbaceae bacterium]|nr:glycosyltransferase family 39 protein [Desulfobulbaceae bacterium]